MNAWLDDYRAPVVRYERKAAHYLSHRQLSATLMRLERLIHHSLSGEVTKRLPGRAGEGLVYTLG